LRKNRAVLDPTRTSTALTNGYMRKSGPIPIR
jgi:hypothetical protein